MNNGRCRLCGKPIPRYSRSDAVFCGEYCRKRYWDIMKGRVKPTPAEKAVIGVEEGGV